MAGFICIRIKFYLEANRYARLHQYCLISPNSFSDPEELALLQIGIRGFKSNLFPFPLKLLLLTPKIKVFNIRMPQKLSAKKRRADQRVSGKYGT